MNIILLWNVCCPEFLSGIALGKAAHLPWENFNNNTKVKLQIYLFYVIIV